MLFSLANLARFIATPAEDALRQANASFTRRFHFIEAELRERKVGFGKATLEEMEAGWQRAKQQEKQVPPPRGGVRTGITRLTFTSPSLAESNAFWSLVAPALGWRVERRGNEAVWLDAGALHIHFRQGAAGEGDVMLEAPSSQDVARVAAAVRQANGSLEEKPDHALFTDPARVRWLYSVPRMR